MRVWTIQPLEVWTQLQAFGELRVDPSRYRNQHIPERYLWLQGQLKFESLPWWAYCVKPDLRRYRWGLGLRAADEQHVRIELEVNEATVFPIWAWDTVYAGGYLALTLAEKLAWEKGIESHPELEDVWPLPQPFREELEASWERLFIPELTRVCPWRGQALSMLENSTGYEAVIEVLRLPDVRHWGGISISRT